jgi:hypothetical protein
MGPIVEVPGKMILRNRHSEAFEHHGQWLLILPPLIFIAMPAILIAAFIGTEDVARFYVELMERGKFGSFILPIFIVGPIVWGTMTVVGRSRLEVTDVGIRFVSGAPNWISQQTDWHMAWADVESVELQTPSMTHPLASVIVMKSSKSARRLQPWQWVVPGGDKVPLVEAMLGRRRRHAQRLIAESPLVTELTTLGYLSDSTEHTITAHDIRRAGTASQIVALVFVFAVVYFIGDSFFGLKEYYAGTPPWQWHFAIALVAAVIVWLALNQAKPGSAEALLVALLFGVGIALAAYPGLLRLNAWMDPSGLIAQEYTLGQGDTWTSNTPTPDLVFDIGSRYWEQFEPGQVKTFQIRRGGLGFYQIDMAPIYAEQKAFYARQELSRAGD